MIEKIKHRFAGEQGFTLIELLVVIVILGVLVAIAVPSYLSFRGKAQTASAQANVRSAIPAAEGYYQGNNPESYSGITYATLVATTPGIGKNVKALSLNSDKGYCVEDSEDNGATTYDYIGGNPGASVSTGYKQSVIQLGDCATATGVTGAA